MDDALDVVAVDDDVDAELLVDMDSDDDDALCMNATDGTVMESSMAADTSERECFFIEKRGKNTRAVYTLDFGLPLETGKKYGVMEHAYPE